MTLIAENLIAHTLEKMQARIASSERDGRIQSGLLFTGNVHDAFPRRLFLDTRLSPLDKMAWMMIRLYAQQNEGAVFPTYDELQLQLASPGKGKTSRETVSRVLLMLRLTGWLSLCRRVRDDQGRVRGNIYAQHDEPLTAYDADEFDPLWLDVVTTSCQHKNKTISMTARNLVSEIRHDPSMRHYHSHLARIEERLGAAQTPEQMAARVAATLSTENEPGKKQTELSQNFQGADPELSQNAQAKRLSSQTEPPVKPGLSGLVRKPNHKYVRNITQSVKKNTYVLPEWFAGMVAPDDQISLLSQLQAQPDATAGYILSCLDRGNPPRNPTGWMLSMLKKAREGQLSISAVPVAASVNRADAGNQRSTESNTHNPVATSRRRDAERASAEYVTKSVASIRAMLVKARACSGEEKTV
ncbi:STY4528 family pathogenicity island replication protein [Klebsiella aerogenes]|uniref:Helix-turn-helix domain-containing protein n=1 Tax=Klebsiella aerogenes TaxID=548 RepID=A0AAP9U7V8_KLEAE|nr:STY4528 family pathogenicity island replication protein [Klebsiella aerogenes]QMR42898.1 helix-turn-helix domain-containing protein [Klebsiella aerogenes]